MKALKLIEDVFNRYCVKANSDRTVYIIHNKNGFIQALSAIKSEPEDELREETKQKLAEENKDSTWKGHSQGYYYHFIEGWDACIDYLKSKINTNN